MSGARLLLGVVVGLGGLMVVGIAGPQAQQDECSIIVQAGQSIQEAIASAPPGAVICLEPGIWYENISISKPLHIHGAGPQATFIKGVRNGPIFLITANVGLANLTITESRGENPLWQWCRPSFEEEHCPIGVNIRERAWVSLHNVIVTGHNTAIAALGTSTLELSQVTLKDNTVGLLGADTARVSGQEVTIGGDGWVGILAADLALVQLERLTISQQQVGIQLEHMAFDERSGAQVKLTESKLSQNWLGLLIEGGKAKLLDTTLEGNFVGVWAQGDPTAPSRRGEVEMERITLSQSQRDGLIVTGTAIVSLRESKILDSGVHPNCQWAAWICNGVTVRESAQLWITNSVIQGSADWGLTAWKRDCGYGQDEFEGTVTLLGQVLIEGNNKSGNQAGMGKPEGQVCLP